MKAVMAEMMMVHGRNVTSIAAEQRQEWKTPGQLAACARALRSAASAATVEAARAVAYAVSLGWWEAMVETGGGDPSIISALPFHGPIATLSRGISHDAYRFGRALAALPVAEAAAALGSLYTQALPAEHRTANGVFYSPAPLVQRLLDKASTAGHDWSLHRAIDPSCGGGAFLVQAAIRMKAALRDTEPSIALSGIAARLRGWDIDPFAVWLANLAVDGVVLPLIIGSGRRLAPVAEVRDALADFEDAKGEWHLAMGNPPFGKVKDTPVIRSRFRRSLHGHPNLYGLFTDLALHLVRPEDGIVVYLTPASYLAGCYFKSLRRLLHQDARPVSIDLVESRKDIFEDVLQEVALSAFKRSHTEGRAECSVIKVTKDGMTVEAAGALILPADPEEPWTLPRNAADAQLVERLRQLPCRLADWGYAVSTGPLVWNRHKPRLHDEPNAGRVAVVWAESVTQDGRFVFRATRRNHKPWFEPRGTDDPNLVDRPCVLVQRTTSKEQARRLVSAEMPAGFLRRFGGKVTVENHLNMIKPVGVKPKVPVPVLAAFLATKTADRVLRCINASVAVSASELEAIPLPMPEDIIAAMSDADPDLAVQRLYGIDL